MQILILTQYFTPEITAPAVRLHAFAKGLAERGHQVEVVCEIPNHPRGIVEPEYRGGLVQPRRLDGFEVDYVWVRASPSKRAASRVASYASYALMASTVASLRRRPDVVLASSPPLPVGAVGLAVAARHRVPWVLDVRDLWPEIALVLGELRPGRLARLAERLERRLYSSASLITTPTESFRAHIGARSPDPEKVVVVPNGTSADLLAIGETQVERSELGLPADRFVWTYAGNVGLSQDLDVALAAAELLDDGFQLVIVGDGAARERLERRASELRPGAVRFTGLVRAEEAARYMRASDALALTLADEPALGKTIPVKLYDYCAVGRPVIVAAPGESRSIAERRGVALAVRPADPAALADGVRRLRDDAGLRQRLSSAGRAFAAEHLRERQVERLDELLRRFE